MRRALATLAAVTTIALVGVAAPASADHFIEATESGCSGGAIATGFGRNIVTDDVRIATRPSGESTWVCTFRDVGASSEEENGYRDYVVPTRAVRWTSWDGCWETDGNGGPVRTGDAHILSRPNGMVTITCTLAPLG